jgi:hypothetical protein
VARKGAKSTARRPDRERSVVGVVGGDTTCLQALVQRWTGRPGRIEKLTETVCVPDRENRREIALLNGVTGSTSLEPWPGGPLIWLVPERGPSEPELALLRQVLRANEKTRPTVRLLVCLPHDVDAIAANDDLDAISETLRWGLDGEVELEIEAVWLSGNEEAGIDRWLAGLG